ncbi:MAG TPA: amidase family protein, partial [Solirubrobacterales bacterium]|nr:amidase family protein [Solirubrobacterales bacterium]
GLVPLDGCFPLAPSFDHAGPIAPSVGGCAEMLEALAPGLERPALDALTDLRIRVAWTADADPLIASRVEASAEIAKASPVELPYANALAPAFMHEVASVHRELHAAHAELYGPNVGTKVRRCLEVTDEEAATARAERERYRERVAGLFDEIDLLLTPTLARVPPSADVDELTLRELYVRFTIPFNATGAPALALPCGEAEDGLPASLQLVGAPGADGLVLAAGELLEEGLRTPSGGSV